MNLDILTIGDCDIDMYMKIDGAYVSTDQSSPEPKICFYHGSKVQVDGFRNSIAATPPMTEARVLTTVRPT